MTSCFLTLGILIAATGTSLVAEPVTVIKAGHLLDGRGTTAIAPAMVRVEGEKIAEVGSNLAVPPGATVIDLGDPTLLPGLIDLHTHLTRWGGQVAAHAHGAAGIKAAIRAGVRTVDHGSDLDEETIALIKASNRKTYYVPTLGVLDSVEENGVKNNVPESERERSRKMRGVMYAGFKRALVAKLPIGLGTDAAVIEHGENWKEFLVRQSLGEPAGASLVAATSLNAGIIGWQDRVGSVVAGKFADLIAVPGDPLQDIALPAGSVL